MKNKILGYISAILMCALVFSGLIACRGSDYDARKLRIVFIDNYGNEFSGPIEYEYDEEKVYTYRYRLYYYDSYHLDGLFIEENEVVNHYTDVTFTIDGDDSGKHNVSVWAVFNNPETGEYVGSIGLSADVTIKDKPDYRVDPEVYFDPNGATLEGEGDDLRYVYKYDGREHYPYLHLRYRGEEIENNLHNEGIVRTHLIDNPGSFEYPKNIGEYQVMYWCYNSDYVRETDRQRFFGCSTTITVEIRQ